MEFFTWFGVGAFIFYIPSLASAIFKIRESTEPIKNLITYLVLVIMFGGAAFAVSLYL